MNKKFLMTLEAMRVAGYDYNKFDSDTNHIVFDGDYGARMMFSNIFEVGQWLDGIVFDDPEIGKQIERIIHPERYN